jgi:predicted transposase YbfD/YdcC
MGESRREHGEKGEIARRYYLVSLPADGGRCSDAVRQHGGVEHQWHGALDVSFAEDASRIRTDKGAQTCSVLRHIAVNLLRRESQHKRGSKARRKRAGGDRDYLLQVLTA